ncbi:ParB/RepB/Spo0J family partition protein [Georgenia sp. M64]|uniref:ParB/RepB/Spo0J family partition protein n=1 Tax=Georgenia sp. M64 TaxID=3120520 RepID=UPI0030E0FF88
MSEKRRGLGRGIGALIPTGPAPTVNPRPVDVFFPATAGSGEEVGDSPAPSAGPSAAQTAARALMAPSARSKAKSSTRRKTPADPSGPGSKNASRAASSSVPPEGTPRRSAPQRGAGAGQEITGATSVETAEIPVAGSGDHTGESTDTAGAISPDLGAGQQSPASAETVTSAEAAEEELDGLVPVPGATFAEIPVDQVVRNARQPRQVFDEEELEELAASIREVGVLQPIVVRPLREPVDGEDVRYELIMGERRWRASRLAGNDTVPAVIRDTGDGDLLRDALLENLHRAQLNPLEEAAAYQALLEDFGCTHDELAARIARSRPQISNTLRLLKLPPLVQRRVAAGVLSAGHARALLGLSDGGAMERLAQKIVAEGLSVRATEEIVALGDEPVAPEMRRRPRAGEHTEALNRLATRLADRLDTRVKVNLGQRKGRIAIEFASVEDLNRILEVLAPGEAQLVANQD